MSNAKKLLIIGIVIAIVLIIAYFGIKVLTVSIPTHEVPTEEIREKARELGKEARIMERMMDLSTAIFNYYSNRKEGFSGVSCSSPELSSICNEIKKDTGEIPTILSSKEHYCLYVKLPSGEYFCSTESTTGSPSSFKTPIFPGGAGYCDGKTFSCPQEHRSLR